MPLHRLTGADAVFLAAERPGQLLHVMGLLILDPTTVPGGYSFERFCAFAASRLPALTPLRRRLVEVPGGLARPFWSEVADVDLAYHIRRAAVPRPGGPQELAAMVVEMSQRPLDRSRPLWEMLMVEGLAGGQVAMIAKLSHAMMDGMAGVRLMASLFNASPEIPDPPAPGDPSADDFPGPLELLAGSVPWLMRQPLRALRAGMGTARWLVGSLRSRSGDQQLPEVPVGRCWLNAPISPYRATAWVTLPLADLRQIGHAHDATVNDVLLAVLSGALRRYAGPRELLPEQPLAAGVPVALPNEEGRDNAVTAVVVGLATDEPDPAARLFAIRDAMTRQKRRRGSTMGEDLMAWADVPPPLLFSVAARAYMDLDIEAWMKPICNLVVSNVPGPPQALYLGGAKLLGIYPLGPVFSGIALNVTAIGCGDGLDIGLVACREVLPDLWTLADALPEALAELREALAHANPEQAHVTAE
jgi:WS/DGAT/MGAT family acyltransferase